MTVAHVRRGGLLCLFLVLSSGCEAESSRAVFRDGGSVEDAVDAGGERDGAQAVPDAGVDSLSESDGSGGDAGACDPRATLAAAKLPALSFAAYHTQAEIIAYLQDVAGSIPEVATYRLLGQSVKGRPIPLLTLNATCRPSPPAILIVGTHHGDEWSSTEAALAQVQYLVRGDEAAMGILDRYAVTIVPVLNPDGHAASPPTRANGNGVDINRDYSFPGRTDAAAFTQPETRLMKSLHGQAKFFAAITYHSGMEAVFWPWCHTGTPTSDDALLSTAGSRMAMAMAYSTYSASFLDYASEGEYIDYAYMADRTLAFTVEVSTQKTPPAASIAPIVATAWRGTISLVATLSDPGAPVVPVRSSIVHHAPRIGNERQE